MSRVFLSIFSIFASIFLFTFPQFVYAHFSTTDRDMTIILHVDPDDDPTPGQQAYVYFLFEDRSKRFQLSQCNCTIFIEEQGKQIYEQKLIEKKDARPSIWGASIPYIFPQKDVYHITITGRSIMPGAFQSFTLSWDFRVDSNDSPGLVTQRPSDVPTILAVILGGTVFFILFGRFIKKEVLDTETVDSHKNNRYNKKKL